MAAWRHRAPRDNPKPKGKRPWVALVAACMVLVAVVAVWAGPKLLGALSGGAASDDFQQAKVLKVVDGDTLKVALADGAENYVRLIGIDTPESVAADESRNSEEGDIAADYTKSLVAVGQVVWLQTDTSDVDKYGRWLRYVWLEKPQWPSDKAEVAEKMLNAVLVREGYAQAKRYKPDVAYAEVFEQWGEEAAAQGKGVSRKWA